MVFPMKEANITALESWSSPGGVVTQLCGLGYGTGVGLRAWLAT